MASTSGVYTVGGPATLIRSVDGRISFWSPEMAARYGFNEAEALGRTAASLLHCRLAEPWQEIEAALLRQGSWIGGGLLRRRDGSTAITALHWHLHRKEDATASFVTEVHADTRPDSAATRQLADVFAIITHQLSEPLTAAVGYLAGNNHLLQQQAPDLAALRAINERACAQLGRSAEALGLLRAVIGTLHNGQDP